MRTFRNFKLCLFSKTEICFMSPGRNVEVSGEKIFVEVRFKFKGWTKKREILQLARSAKSKFRALKLGNRQDWKSHVLESSSNLLLT
jgi:hypothetical protein